MIKITENLCGSQRQWPTTAVIDFEQEPQMADAKPRLDLDEIGDVTVATFIDKKILDEANINEVGKQLFALIDEDGRRKIVLDFSVVEYLSSAALGKLITMDKKAKGAKSKLRLCCIKPDIYEVFEITRLNKIFDIKPTLEEAVKGF
jgi:anti-sigma B factor antagonist